ncbi:MAG: UvrD-helicase domain-containing protein, partial [Solirubrobacteraceae bacterium]
MSEDHARLPSRPQLDLLSDATAAVDGLLPAQRAVATHAEPSVVVLGAAGTGKTRVIETRFRWLVAHGCEPGRIGILVPSSARAAALRARIESWLGPAYDELLVLAPAQLAAVVLHGTGSLHRGLGDPFGPVLGAGDRLAMLLERIDELTLRNHDFGGRPTALLSDFVRRIDRLKAELVTADRYASWARSLAADGTAAPALEREFAEIFQTHERLLREAG